MPRLRSAVADLVSQLKSAEVDSFHHQWQQLTADGVSAQSYTELSAVCAAVAELLQKQSHSLSSGQRRALATVAQVCCRHMQHSLPDSVGGRAKHLQLLYYVMFACHKGEQLECIGELGELVVALVPVNEPGARLAAQASGSVANSSRLLLACGRTVLSTATSAGSSSNNNNNSKNNDNSNSSSSNATTTSSSSTNNNNNNSSCRLADRLLTAGVALCCHLTASVSVAKLLTTGLAVAETLLHTRHQPPASQLPAQLLQLSQAIGCHSGVAAQRLVLAAVRLTAVGASVDRCVQQLQLSEAAGVADEGMLQLLHRALCRLTAEQANSSDSDIDSCSDQLASVSLCDSDSDILLADTLYTLYTVLRLCVVPTDTADSSSPKHTTNLTATHVADVVHVVYRLLVPLVSSASGESSCRYLTVINVPSSTASATPSATAAGTASASYLSAPMPLNVLSLLSALMVSLDLSTDCSATRRLGTELAGVARLLLTYCTASAVVSDSTWCLGVLLSVAGNVYTMSDTDTHLATGAFQLYLACCRQLRRCSLELPVSSLVTRVTHLTMLLRKHGQWDTALAALADVVCLSRDQATLNSAHRDQLMSAWASVKRAARRQDKQHSCLDMAISEYLLQRDSSFPQSDLLSLLKQELKKCHGSGNLDMSQTVSVCLDRLCDLLAGEGEVKCDLSLDGVWLHVTRVRHGHLAVDPAALRHSDRLLQWLSAQCERSDMSTVRKKDNGHTVAVTVARCVALTHHCLLIKRLEMAHAALHPLEVSTDPSGGGGDDSAVPLSRRQQHSQAGEEVDLNSSCTVTAPRLPAVTVASESVCVQLLTECVSTADLLLAAGVLVADGSGGGGCGGGEWFGREDVRAALLTTAELASGLGYSLLALRAWRSLYHLAVALDHKPTQIDAVCELSERDAYAGLFNDQRAHIAADSDQQRPFCDIRQQLARAWRHFHRGQYAEASAVLDQSVLPSAALTVRWIEPAATAASAHRLAALLATSSGCDRQQLQLAASTEPLYDLEHAALACYFARCVTHWSSSDHETCVSKQVYYNGLALECLSLECRLYSDAHCAREMRRHCRASLQTTHRAASALRLTALLQWLTEADLMCEDTADASLKVSLANRLLFGPVDPPASATDTCAVPLPVPVLVTEAARGAAGSGDGGRQLELPSSSPERQACEQRDQQQRRTTNALDGMYESVGSPPGRESRWQKSHRWRRCASPSLRRPEPALSAGRLLAPVPGHRRQCDCLVCVEPVRVQLSVALCRQRALLAALDDTGDGSGDGRSAASVCCQLAATVLPSVQRRVHQMVGDWCPALSASEWSAELLCEERLRCLLAAAQLQCCRKQLPEAESTLRSLQQLLRSCSEQFVSRHTSVLEQLCGWRLMINSVLAWTGPDERAPAALLQVPSEEPALSGRLTPPLAPRVTTSAAAPRRAPRRVDRTIQKEQQQQQSPPLVRRSRRAAAAVLAEIKAAQQ